MEKKLRQIMKEYIEKVERILPELLARAELLKYVNVNIPSEIGGGKISFHSPEGLILTENKIEIPFQLIAKTEKETISLPQLIMEVSLDNNSVSLKKKEDTIRSG